MTPQAQRAPYSGTSDPEGGSLPLDRSAYERWLLCGVAACLAVAYLSYHVGHQAGLESAPIYVEGKRDLWGYTPPVEDGRCEMLLDTARDILIDMEARN